MSEKVFELSLVAMRGGKDASVPRALELLGKDHALSPKLGPLCQTLRYAEAPAGDDFLRAVMDNNPSHELKGQATYSLSFRLHRRADRPEAAGKPEAARLLRQAEDLFERVVRDYGDVEAHRGTLTDAAWGDLYEIHHLEVGMKAPDIQGDDLDGKPFKLSDYRGKVVVLDFWGNW